MLPIYLIVFFLYKVAKTITTKQICVLVFTSLTLCKNIKVIINNEYFYRCFCWDILISSFLSPTKYRYSIFLFKRFIKERVRLLWDYPPRNIKHFYLYVIAQAYQYSQ